MKPIFILSFFLLVAVSSMAKNTDTIYVKPGDLDLKALQTGKYSYFVIPVDIWQFALSTWGQLFNIIGSNSSIRL